MGSGRYNATDWTKYSNTTATRSTASIFTSKTVPDEFNPKNFSVRESRDSVDNPNSNAIIIASDVTGSMGMIAEALVRKAIGKTFEQILERSKDHTSNMVTDPHLMVLG